MAKAILIKKKCLIGGFGYSFRGLLQDHHRWEAGRHVTGAVAESSTPERRDRKTETGMSF